MSGKNKPPGRIGQVLKDTVAWWVAGKRDKAAVRKDQKIRREER